VGRRARGGDERARAASVARSFRYGRWMSRIARGDVLTDRPRPPCAMAGAASDAPWPGRPRSVGRDADRRRARPGIGGEARRSPPVSRPCRGIMAVQTAICLVDARYRNLRRGSGRRSVGRAAGLKGVLRRSSVTRAKGRGWPRLASDPTTSGPSRADNQSSPQSWERHNGAR
jgi:hypothetical protein